MAETHILLFHTVPVTQYEQICTKCEATSNIIVNIVDAYDARGEVLAVAATLANQFTATRFDSLESGELSCRAVAAAAFMIAMKLRDKTQPLISDLVELTGTSQAHIQEAEISILEALDWKVNITTGVYESDFFF